MDRGIGRVTAVVGVLVVLVGAVGAAYAMGLLGVPSVDRVDNRFAGVNETTTLIETDLTVSNPNPIGVSLGDLGIDYTVWLNEVALANGSKEGVAVETGNSTLTFTTAMSNERIPGWWVSHIRNGEHTTMRVEANVTSGLLGRSVEVTPVERPVDTDILSAFNSTETRPVNANSPLVSDPVLYVNETSAHWGDVSTARTPIDLAFVVYNPKPAPYVITEIRYTITMNEIAVGDGATDREYVIAPRTEETVRTTTAIRNERLDEWWVSHLDNDQVTGLRIEFSATVALPGGQTVDVPLDALTYTETIETDFFGNQADDGAAAGDDGSRAADDGDDTGQDGETSTATDARSDDGSDGDDTPTPTPTPTPGEDDDPIGTPTDVL
jgi:LEA14-like dessication related protein